MANKAAPRQAGLRLTLLVNYWDRRPLPPVCRDYDGTIYAALCNAKAESSEHPNAQDIAMPG